MDGFCNENILLFFFIDALQCKALIKKLIFHLSKINHGIRITKDINVSMTVHIKINKIRYKKRKNKTQKPRTRRCELADGFENLPNVYDKVKIGKKFYYYVDREHGPVYNKQRDLAGIVLNHRIILFF
jgi:hypothetical protein